MRKKANCADTEINRAVTGSNRAMFALLITSVLAAMMTACLRTLKRDLSHSFEINAFLWY